MNQDPANTTVLVTGAGGFLAIHCLIQLLEQGYQVRGTLRSAAREAELRTTLAKFVKSQERLTLLAKFVKSQERLTFVQADLLDDSGWDEAVCGCTYVLHVASPFPLDEPADPNDLIRPAVEGTLRVLRAALVGGVRRVVLTSSTAAIASGHPESKHTFDESDWSNIDALIGAYAKSKTLAERAAWDFVKDHPALELAVINPGLILGPLPDARARSSGELIYQLMKVRVPGVARMHFNAVDVRDVAFAHLAAMRVPEAAGQRFVCVSASFWMKAVAVVLRKHFAARGYNVRTLEFPSALVRFIALFDEKVRLTVAALDKSSDLSNERIKRVLGWQPRGLEEMVVAMGESLIANGLL